MHEAQRLADAPDQPPLPAPSGDELRDVPPEADNADLETRAFWNWALPNSWEGEDPADYLLEEEQRVLSKATSGGGSPTSSGPTPCGS